MTNNVNAWAKSLAIATSLAWGLTAQAAPITTTAQIKSFSLTPKQATFFTNTFISDPDAPRAPNTASGPQTAQQQLTFAKFNSSLGTLTGVTFSLNSLYSANLLLDSTYEDSAEGSSATAALQLLLSGTGLINDRTSNLDVSGTCPYSSSILCTKSVDSGSISFDVNEFFGLAPLSSFTGPGTFDLTAKASTSISPVDPPDNGTFTGTFTGNWNGQASLIYTYEARSVSVPEPQSLLLVATALAGLAAIRRRRA